MCRVVGIRAFGAEIVLRGFLNKPGHDGRGRVLSGLTR